jgi:hypothetical protein
MGAKFSLIVTHDWRHGKAFAPKNLAQADKSSPRRQSRKKRDVRAKADFDLYFGAIGVMVISMTA